MSVSVVTELADTMPLATYQKWGCPKCLSLKGAILFRDPGTILFRCECGIGRFLTWDDDYSPPDTVPDLRAGIEEG